MAVFQNEHLTFIFTAQRDLQNNVFLHHRPKWPMDRLFKVKVATAKIPQALAVSRGDFPP